jgi:hypothetical protein
MTKRRELKLIADEALDATAMPEPVMESKSELESKVGADDEAEVGAKVEVEVDTR